MAKEKVYFGIGAKGCPANSPSGFGWRNVLAYKPWAADPPTAGSSASASPGQIGVSKDGTFAVEFGGEDLPTLVHAFRNVVVYDVVVAIEKENQVSRYEVAEAQVMTTHPALETKTFTFWTEFWCKEPKLVECPKPPLRR